MNSLLFILGLLPIWKDMPNVTIVQDSAIIQVMEAHWASRTYKEVGGAGWRVQVFSSNDPRTAKTEAEAVRRRLEKSLDQPIFVNYLQPFWKVRIGNFKSMEDAKAYRDKLVQKFPELQADAYPVKDQVKIIKK